ncbi:hypothetical protein NKH18_39650 [Streptomyces sp. M10(2022)]
MSDITFALERYVEQRLTHPIPSWHVDRSRNDLQATAQLMYGRQELIGVARMLADFGGAVHRLAGPSREMPMPGHTHFQAAQIISPGTTSRPSPSRSCTRFGGCSRRTTAWTPVHSARAPWPARNWPGTGTGWQGCWVSSEPSRWR